MADLNLQQILTLKLSKQWLPIGQTPIQKLMVDMVTGVVCGIDINYEENDDGNPDFNEISSMEAVKWKEWINLPVRDWETAIHTRTLTIRVPFVVVCSKYSKIPIKQILFPSKKNVWDRDNNICQYTGMALSREMRSIDHIVPQTKGGQNEWHNLVTCHRSLNSWKSDTDLEDCFLGETEFVNDPELEEWRLEQMANRNVRLELIKEPGPPKPALGTVFTKTRDEWSALMFN